MPVPAIILAAGASRRLGHPKQLVLIGGETLLARTIRVVRESGAAPIVVVLGANRGRVETDVDFGGVQVVTNEEWEQGIATSIHAGIRGLGDTHPEAVGAMLLVCDQPKLSVDHLRSLVETFEGAGSTTVVASRYAEMAAIPAIFPAREFGRLLKLSGDTGARLLLREPAGLQIEVPFAGGVQDIDTPEDVRAILEASR